MFVKIANCSVNTFPVVIDGLLSTAVDGRDVQGERWTDCADMLRERGRERNKTELLPRV